MIASNPCTSNLNIDVLKKDLPKITVKFLFKPNQRNNSARYNVYEKKIFFDISLNFVVQVS